MTKTNASTLRQKLADKAIAGWVRIMLLLTLLTLAAGSAKAVDPTADDVVTAVHTTFTSVATLVVAVVTFFIGVRFVKYIKR